MKNFIFYFTLLSFMLTVGCQKTEENSPKKELLIYCGITMIRPMQEIARIIEQKHNCIIKITKQGSGALLKSIETNMVGDLFLPGSESYMKICLEKGWVKETVDVGFNRAALIVQKGNPLAITADLHNLLNKKYRTVLGSTENGSIGKETERILNGIGIYQQAIDNALYLTADSKGMVQALHKQKVDLVLNWYATALWEENKPFMDALQLDDDIAPPHKLVLGLLTFSPYPDIARSFLALAGSKQGKDIFASHGFQ
jgi:molybdate transport system substrate-binding protein